MAQESEDGQEKTEEPTEKRLQTASEEGQIARSRELANLAVFGASTWALVILGSSMANSVAQWMRHALSFGPEQIDNVHSLPTRYGTLMVELVQVVSPLVLACLMAGFLAPVLMGGIHFSSKALLPNLGKLNPVAGFGRIFSTDGLAELVRSILRVVLIGGMAGMGIYHGLPLLVSLIYLPIGSAARTGLGLILHVMVLMSSGLFLLAAVDVVYQRRSHRQKLMMTRQEVTEELKESQGRPEVKARIRRVQQAMSQRRMMEDVPKADVILVNPTHYAVALKYEAGSMRAPKLVAKGADEIAHIIRQLATHHGVPIVSSPPLARSLYKQVQIGREIPVELYAAVALILGYVYQLNAWHERGGRMPDVPTVDVPEVEDK